MSFFDVWVDGSRLEVNGSRLKALNTETVKVEKATAEAIDSDSCDAVCAMKRSQCESQAFQMRWYEWCDQFGRGCYDPARHPSRYLGDFLANEFPNINGSSLAGHLETLSFWLCPRRG